MFDRSGFRARLAGAAALMLILALLGVSCGRIKSYLTDGRTEMHKALEAKKKATSFKSRTEITGPEGRKLVTESAVSCPDRQSLKTSMGDSSYQSIRVGQAGYVQVAEGGPWQKMAIPPDAVPCGSNAGVPAPWAVMSEGTDLLTTLAMMSQGADFQRGAFRQTDAGPCQEWIMGFSHPGAEGKKSGSMQTILCVGEDSLPRHITLGKTAGIKVTYYDWNKPVSIEAPANAVELKMDGMPEGADPHGGMASPHGGMANPHALPNPHK